MNDHRAAGAKKILEDIKDALRHDEHVVSLKTALVTAKRRGISLLSETAPPPKPEPTPRDRPRPQPGRHIVDSRAVESIPAAATRRYGLVPLDRMGEVLSVASCHHLDETIRRAIERHAGCRLALTVATVGEVRAYHEKAEDSSWVSSQ